MGWNGYGTLIGPERDQWRSQISCSLQAGDLGKEVGRSPPLTGGQVSAEKYKLPRGQRSHKIVAGSSKRLASRFYELKMGHCLTSQYLNWTESAYCQVLAVPVQDPDAGACH
jgi:hypothetical protein